MSLNQGPYSADGCLFFQGPLELQSLHSSNRVIWGIYTGSIGATQRDTSSTDYSSNGKIHNSMDNCVILEFLEALFMWTVGIRPGK